MSDVNYCNKANYIMRQPQKNVKKRRNSITGGASGDYTNVQHNIIPENLSKTIDKSINQLSCRKFTLPTVLSESMTPNREHRQQLLIDTIHQLSITSSPNSNNTTPKQKLSLSVWKNCSQSVKVVKKNLHYPHVILRRTASLDDLLLNHYSTNSISRNSNKKILILNKKPMNLNEITNDKVHADEQNRNINNGFYNDNEMCTISNAHMKQAARRIAFMFVLHAWRQCRTLVTDILQQSDKLEAQVYQQNLQLSVLRELINSDNKRIALANETARKSDEALTLARQNEENERNEKLKLENEIKKIEEKIKDYITEIENSHNNINLLQSDVAAFETHLNKEREKIIKLREDKKQLKEKLKQTETKLKQAESDNEKIKLTHAQLKEYINKQKIINENYEENIKYNDSIINNLQNKNLELERKIEDNMKQLLLKDTELIMLNNELKLTKINIDIFHEKNCKLEQQLHETQTRLQEQYERSWWSLAIQVASGPANILLSILRITLPALSLLSEIQSSNVENDDKSV